MAIFRVEITEIQEVRHHPSADRLDLAKVGAVDLQFVVGRDQYKPGDSVVYFPIDSLLPEELVELMGLTGRLSGPKKNRVKTVELRHQISQGLVCGLQTIADFLKTDAGSLISDTLTELLGVEKYEPPVIPCLHGKLVPLPPGVSVYDIEGCERFPQALRVLETMLCCITEKVEGMNAGLTVNADNDVIINQRNFAIIEDQHNEHMIGKAFRAQGLDALARKIKASVGANQVTLRGELIGPGVQGNYYGLSDHRILLFDIMVDYNYLDATEFMEVVPAEHRVPVVDSGVLLSDFLSKHGGSLALASDGPSLLSPVDREGLVVKPMFEVQRRDFGRLIIKKRGPIYLAHGDN